jgi:hypothetical protein
MNLTLKMDMDNAAFEDTPASEAARILRDVAALMEFGEESGNLRDVNGNKVGTWRVKGGKSD